MKLMDIIVREAIVPAMVPRERDAAVAVLVDAMVAAGSVPATDRDAIYKAVLQREQRGSTAWGRGIAVPHNRHKSLQRLSLAIGLSQHGIEFSALDRQPVFTVFLLLSPEDRHEEHLQAMETICSNLGKETFKRFMRQATTVDEVMTLLEEADNQLIR
ncbi:MAG: PTS sugar transporter subunit IIA [Phycisphaerales bacterium]|nr:PTS sugar transporter subunit IIA [Phycisphaerales bacterium]